MLFYIKKPIKKYTFRPFQMDRTYIERINFLLVSENPLKKEYSLCLRLDLKKKNEKIFY